MLSLRRNLIARAHLDDLTMHGIKRYRRFVALCIMQWRPLIDPSSFLASSWRTSSTTNDLILLNAPFVDPDDTAFSTHTTDLLTATSRPRKPDTSTTHTHPEIAETYVITGRKSSNSRRLHLSSHRNPTSGTMETWRRFSWLQQGEWFGFPFQNSPKPILQLQRHWRYGSFASPTLEVLVPRITQYMAPSYCLRQRNLRPSFRQHRHYSICGWIGIATTNSECGLGQVSHFQVTLHWPIREPKRGHSNYGKRSCSVASILASSSTVCRRGQPTAHSWIRSWTGKDESGQWIATTYRTWRSWACYNTHWKSTTRTTIGFSIVWPFVSIDLSGICQSMACGQPTFVADWDPIQEVVERLETPSTQTRYFGKAFGKSHGMVAKPTWWCGQNHPESKCGDGHWPLQTQKRNHRWDCPQGHDGSYAGALLTSFVFEITWLKSSQDYANTGSYTFLYSCFGFVDSVHFVPFCWCIFCLSDDSNSIDGPACVITPTSQFKTAGLVERHSVAARFLLHIVGRLTCRSPMLQTPSSGVRPILPYCQFPTEVMWVPLLLLFWIVNIRAIGNSCRCNRINSFWPK